MIKRMFLPFLAAVLLAANFPGTALAAEAEPGLIKARGEVVEVNPAGGSFQIEKTDGTRLTFEVNVETSFRGQAQSLEELQPGWKVGVAAREGEDGVLWAVLVLSGEPKDFIKARGTVTDVNTSAGKFTLQTPDGVNLTFSVDAGTRYGGHLQGLEDLKEGWKAAVVAVEDNPGKLLAVGLAAGAAPGLIKARGQVSTVDPGGSKFQIETPQGETLSLTVDENTRYRGQVEGIGDLEEGMQTAVAAIEGLEGNLVARWVLAGDLPDDKPGIARAQGVIHSVSPGAGKFTLEKKDGTRLTVYIDSKTIYKGQVEGFDDLEKGLRAGFIGFLDQDGKVIARVVLAGHPRPDGSGEVPDAIRPGGELPGPEFDPLLEPQLGPD